LVVRALADEATRRLLLEATRVDDNGWVRCPGPGCTMKVTMCLNCHAVGCWAYFIDATCPNTLLDRETTCRRCGHEAVLNRVVKAGYYVLGEAWRALHPQT
jgi:hypothetical protein